MNSLLNSCLEHTFGNEGGYYNHPNDKGGPTKYGIAFNFNVERLAARGITSPDQMKDLSIDIAADIAEEGYWIRAKCDLFDAHQIKTLQSYFDMVYHAGRTGGALCLQRAINDFRNGSAEPDIAVDGKVGPNTIAALHKLVDGSYDPDTETNDSNFCKALGARRIEYYFSLYNDPDSTWYRYKRFLNSGLRRV